MSATRDLDSTVLQEAGAALTEKSARKVLLRKRESRAWRAQRERSRNSKLTTCGDPELAAMRSSISSSAFLCLEVAAQLGERLV